MVLRAFKAEWKRRWYKKRNELVQQGEFTTSGRVRNPGKYFYLKLVKEVVDELNNRTIDNCSLARMSMIACGSIPNISGIWHVEQLSDELRGIVENNTEYFNGLDPES